MAHTDWVPGSMSLCMIAHGAYGWAEINDVIIYYDMFYDEKGVMCCKGGSVLKSAALKSLSEA